MCQIVSDCARSCQIISCTVDTEMHSNGPNLPPPCHALNVHHTEGVEIHKLHAVHEVNEDLQAEIQSMKMAAYCNTRSVHLVAHWNTERLTSDVGVA